MATIEDKYNQIVKMTNLKQYYDRGFKGDNVRVCSVESLKSDHGSKVYRALKTYAPQCEVISFNDEMGISATGDQGTIDTINFPKFADWCIENKVDIVTSSLNWSCDKEVEKEAIKKLYDKGIIFFNCVPNKDNLECKLDENGDKTYNIDKEIVSVGGVQVTFKSNGTSKETYNFAYGEAVDVIGYNDNVPYLNENNKWSTASGNSFATPLVAAMFAVMMSANGLIDSKNAMELIEKCSSPFVYKDRTYNQLNLPDLDKLLETTQEKEDKVEAPVVQPSAPIVGNSETSGWAKEARDELMKLGITDGTNPKKQITREEVWTMLYRLYNKI